MIQRRTLCKSLLSAPSLWSASSVFAQSSRRQASLIVPYTTGGSADLLGRLFAMAMSDASSDKLIVENKPGANSMLGANYVTSAPPDGRTLLYTLGNLLLNQEFLLGDLNFRPLDTLVPVVRTCILQALILTGSDSPFNSLSEFIELARKNPKKYTHAYFGDLGIPAIAADSGIEVLRVPYKGGLPGMIDVAGGQVSVITSTLAQSRSMLQSGKVKAIAAFGDERIKEFPNVQTVKEVLPNFRALDYQAVMASKSTPRPILERLSVQMNGVLANAAVRQSFAERGAIVSPLAGLDETLHFMEADRAQIAKVVKAAGIQPS